MSTHWDKRLRWKNRTNSLHRDYRYLTWLTVKRVLTYLWRHCIQNTRGGGIADRHSRPAGGCWDCCVPCLASEGCSLLTPGYSWSWVISPCCKSSGDPRSLYMLSLEELQVALADRGYNVTEKVHLLKISNIQQIFR